MDTYKVIYSTNKDYNELPFISYHEAVRSNKIGYYLTIHHCREILAGEIFNTMNSVYYRKDIYIGIEINQKKISHTIKDFSPVEFLNDLFYIENDTLYIKKHVERDEISMALYLITRIPTFTKLTPDKIIERILKNRRDAKPTKILTAFYLWTKFNNIPKRDSGYGNGPATFISTNLSYYSQFWSEFKNKFRQLLPTEVGRYWGYPGIFERYLTLNDDKETK